MTAAPGSAPEYIIETRGLTREFKGFVAVRKVDLRVRRGHIHALIGPNGAGKTTCFNLLTKFLDPDPRTDPLPGRRHHPRSSASLARRGIVRSFQVSAVFPHLTVLENVRVALQRPLGTTFHFWKRESTLAVLDARARSCSSRSTSAPSPAGSPWSCPTAASARSRSRPRSRWSRS